MNDSNVCELLKLLTTVTLTVLRVATASYTPYVKRKDDFKSLQYLGPLTIFVIFLESFVLV